ncbi:MAG: hypothetical protein WCG87_02670 [Bacteroidota bacterium]
MLHQSRKRTARDLFFQTDLTQQKIAQLTGISPKTLYLWIKNDNWKKMKDAAICSPAALCEQYYAQLHDLNTRINLRDEGYRNPTHSESEVIRRLSVTIKNLGKKISLAPSINIATALIEYIGDIDPELAFKVSEYANNFFANKTDPMILDFYSEQDYQEEELKYKEEFEQIENDELMAITAEQERISNNSVLNRKSIGNDSVMIGNDSVIISNSLETDKCLNTKEISTYDASNYWKNTG